MVLNGANIQTGGKISNGFRGGTGGNKELAKYMLLEDKIKYSLLV